MASAKAGLGAGMKGKTDRSRGLLRYPRVRLFLNDSLVDERPAGYVQQFKAVLYIALSGRYTARGRCG